ncbi:MAG: PTS sugar transporter subunit IIA [Anaerolineales bacterium]|nr:PTS sugar transporter subunit IIA [Anaerolineales bacterium]
MVRLQESFIFVDLEAQDSDEVIAALAGSLFEAGSVAEGYGKAAIERERIHATGLPTRPFPIAFPHADSEGVHQSALAVAIHKTPVVFRNMADPDEELAVELVIMLANKSPEEQIETLRSLAELFGDPDKLSELRYLKREAKIVEWLKRELAL